MSIVDKATPEDWDSLRASIGYGGTSSDDASEDFSVTESGAMKDDKGKLRVDLVAPEMIEALAAVLGAGVAKGYPARNWEKGLPLLEASLASLKRHMLKFEKGVDVDEETGLSHLAHAFVNIGMAYTNYKRHAGEVDDRG